MGNLRPGLIVGNWKMNLLIPDSAALAEEILDTLGSSPPVQVGIAPPFTALESVREALAGSGIALGGQNICSEPQGAFTGEISASMLKDAGCGFVILGHSERRTHFGEEDALINKKIKTAQASGLNIILCVGETLAQRDEGKTNAVIEQQLLESLLGLSGSDMHGIVIAYEPVWAIGTGQNAEPGQAQVVHRFIRDLLEETFGKEVSGAMRIQYGGSVNPENSRELFSQEDIDGALVGGASLEADSFCDIIKSADFTREET